MERITAGLLSGLYRAEATLAVAAYALVAGLLMADIIARQFFGASVYGAQRYAVVATMIAAFMGMSMASSRGTHLRAEALDKIVPERWAKQADFLGYLLSFLLFAVLAWVSFRFMLNTRALGMRISVIGWQLWPFQLVLPLAFSASSLKYLAFAAFPTLAPRREIDTITV